MKRGFSLIEVTIATGIAAFGIITLLGLLPSGMNMFRDAMNVTVSSQIAQRLIKEALQTDYDTLVGTATPTPGVPITKETRYFNDEGVEVEKPADAIFHAHTRIMPATNLPGTATALGNSSLATITVQVAYNPSNGDIPILGTSADGLQGTIDPDTRIPFVTYNSHIAKIK